MKFATKTIHAGQPSEPETGSLIAPIFQTSTYEQESPGRQRASTTRARTTRRASGSNPCSPSSKGVQHCRGVCLRPRRRERGSAGLSASRRRNRASRSTSTAAPIASSTKSSSRSGSSSARSTSLMPAALEPHHSAHTKLVWIESPTNPRLLVYDIAAIAAWRTRRGALLVVDNTFATPCFQQPFELGADIVVHSVTKYLAGHSDLIQGAALAKDPAIFEPIKFLQNATGAVPAPFDCWLTLRGLKTLELRMQRHEENAAAIAKALEHHPLVSRVYFPGLASHPGHDIARKQMTGFGGMVSFELNGSMEEVVAFASSRRFFTLGESLGGVKALLCHPATMTHASIPPEARAELGLSDNLLRLSPGCENAEDLVEDLLEGLSNLERAREAQEEGRKVVTAGA